LYHIHSTYGTVPTTATQIYFESLNIDADFSFQSLKLLYVCWQLMRDAYIFQFDF